MSNTAGETQLEGDPKSNEGVNLDDLIEEHILPKLDPDFLEYFASVQARQRAQGQLAPTNSIERVRAHPELYRAPCALDTSGYPRVTDHVCPSRDNVDIPVRVYHPDPATHGSGPYPVHLNFHGKSSRSFWSLG
jgi:hypothetical protein